MTQAKRKAGYFDAFYDRHEKLGKLLLGFSAIIFILLHIGNGDYNTGLALRSEATRSPLASDSAKDLVSIDLSIQQGQGNRVELDSIFAIVNEIRGRGTIAVDTLFLGDDLLERSVDQGFWRRVLSGIGCASASYSEGFEEKRHLVLPSNDEVHLAFWFEGDRVKAYKIDFYLLGSRNLPMNILGFPQWRTFLVVPPGHE